MTAGCCSDAAALAPAKPANGASGRFVERGEPVETAATREAFEESGLRVELGPLLGLFSEAGETVVLAVYLATAFTGEPVAGDDLDEIGWFGPDALPELAFPHDERIVRLWQKHRAEPS